MNAKTIKYSKNQLVFYQAKSGKIEFRGDFKHDTIWGTQQQIADLFGVQIPAISKHLAKIYKSEELNKNSTVSILETVQKEGERLVKREIEYYNLDVIISVGYRINSKQATKFRIWAINILKKHLIQGYTINRRSIGKNLSSFMKAVENVKALLPAGDTVNAKDVLELINLFANTWFSLDAYDAGSFPQSGISKKSLSFTTEELRLALIDLKRILISRTQATELFGQEKGKDVISGIVGNVFQTFDGRDVYSTIEEKAAHLLYFIVKNHPFIDGNKRSGAFAFVWFLRKAGLLRQDFTPEALTVLTLLIAESKPGDKEKMIGLVLLLLKREYK